MLEPLLLLGILVAVFAGINTGGSATGESFGPTVGSGVLSTRKAAALMAISALLGGVTVGQNVVNTLGHGFVPEQYFTLPAAIGVLLFTGIGILLGNLRGVSVSTSETAVGAVAGMGAALGVLDWSTVGRVVSWWLASPIIAFWITAVIGRYFFDEIRSLLDLESGRRSTAGEIAAVAMACYMGFSAGASNVANAVAPLVGSGELAMTPAVILGGLAMGAGAFLIGPRTMKTVGNDITQLPLEAALIVEVVAATIITLLSLAGIPASLAITAITCVIGLGWGRATRRVPVQRTIGLKEETAEDRQHIEQDDLDLYNIETTREVITTWFASPTVAAVLAFVVFSAADYLGMIGV